MTFNDKVLELLTERGMFQSQAEEVLTRVRASTANEAMQGRWNDHVEGYPEVVLNVLWLSVKREALSYIEEKCPLAWFRPMFEDKPVEVEQEK